MCSSEAPVRSTLPGSTPGAVLGRVASSLLTKADCPAEVLNAPPTVWKTVQRWRCQVSLLLSRFLPERGGKGGVGERTQKVGRGGCKVFGTYVGLGDTQAMHDGKGHGGSDEELIANPLRGRGANVESVDQADGNGGQHRADKHDLLRATGLHDDRAAGEGEHGRRKHERKVVDAGFDGARAQDALKVDGQVVQEDNVAPHEEELVRGRGRERALLVESRQHHGVIAQPDLPCHQGDGDESEADEKTDDNAAVPGMGVSSILKGQDKTDDASHGQRDTNWIHMQQLLRPRHPGRRRSSREAEKEEDRHRGDPPNRQVDVKTPSPTDMVGECATKKRSKNGSKGICHPNDTHHHRSLCWWDREGDDTGATHRQAGAAQPSNSPSNDQGLGVGRDYTDQTPDLEDEHRY